MASIKEEPNHPLVNGVSEAETSTEHKKKLCATCLSLDLRADRFIIDKGSSSAQTVHNRFIPRPESLRMSGISL